VTFTYLSLDDAMRAIALMKIGPVRDIGLLDSALSRPRASAFGEDAYPTLGLKAAALLHSLTKNHCLVDGNKRIAWLLTTIFCDLNEFAIDLVDDDAFQLVWDIAAGEVSLPEIEKRLNLQPRQ
jgi:death-on-curing protein